MIGLPYAYIRGLLGLTRLIAALVFLFPNSRRRTYRYECELYMKQSTHRGAELNDTRPTSVHVPAFALILPVHPEQYIPGIPVCTWCVCPLIILLSHLTLADVTPISAGWKQTDIAYYLPNSERALRFRFLLSSNELERGFFSVVARFRVK